MSKDGLADWYENGVDRLFHGAPAALVVAADRSLSSCPQEDALLATQNILLAAEAVGVATCLIGFVVEAAARDDRSDSGMRFGLPRLKIDLQRYRLRLPRALSFKRYAGRKLHNSTDCQVDRNGNESPRNFEQEPGEMKQQNKKNPPCPCTLLASSMGYPLMPTWSGTSDFCPTHTGRKTCGR
jgi:hypothetical protein